jgi:alpha-beta hydrolase superfamily lysophospholipase
MKANARAMAAALVLAASLPGGRALAFTETPVEAEVENGPLRGTLLAPDGAAKAAIVIIPGSGPTDRDGNSPLGVRASYLKMLAEALAGHGIASIRIDKRGIFQSRSTFPDPNAVTFDDYAADALAWVAVAKEKAGVDCVWLAGHSEGGLVALVAAQQAGTAPCGLVLLATPGRKMGVVLAGQLRANPANAAFLDDALAAITSLERGERVDAAGLDPSLQGLFSPAIQDFLIDAFSRDPAALVAEVALPVLIVQGEADLQVGAADAGALARAQPEAEHRLLPGMNHVLKAVPEGDMAANLAAYGDPSLPLAPGLADAIAEFILRER